MSFLESRRVIHAGAGALSVLVLACTPGQPSVAARPPGGLYAMPADLALARSPDRVNAARAAELAEAALFLLNPERPGGPDYAGAARMCLMASDAAVPGVESDLRASCHRVAARSALRSGDKALYIQAVDRWDEVATAIDRSAGEFLVHAAIRDRLRGETGAAVVSDPLLRRVLQPSTAEPTQENAQSQVTQPQRTQPERTVRGRSR